MTLDQGKFEDDLGVPRLVMADKETRDAIVATIMEHDPEFFLRVAAQADAKGYQNRRRGGEFARITNASPFIKAHNEACKLAAKWRSGEITATDAMTRIAAIFIFKKPTFTESLAARLLGDPQL